MTWLHAVDHALLSSTIHQRPLSHRQLNGQRSTTISNWPFLVFLLFFFVLELCQLWNIQEIFKSNWKMWRKLEKGHSLKLIKRCEQWTQRWSCDGHLFHCIVHITQTLWPVTLEHQLYDIFLSTPFSSGDNAIAVTVSSMWKSEFSSDRTKMANFSCFCTRPADRELTANGRVYVSCAPVLFIINMRHLARVHRVCGLVVQVKDTLSYTSCELQGGFNESTSRPYSIKVN